MAHVGRRVEVYWPPEGNDAEGTWYQGHLDRYDNNDGGGGGTGLDGDTGGGYHVVYDDGDEETLGEIDGRDDVRLLGGETRRSERGSGSYEVTTHGASALQQQDGARGYSGPEEIPRAETMRHPCDENSSDEGSPLGKLLGQPLGQFRGGGASSGPYEVHKAGSGIGREPERIVGTTFRDLGVGDGRGVDARDEESGSYGGSVDGSRSPLEMACGNSVDVSYREIERPTSPREPPGDVTDPQRCLKGTGGGGSDTGSYRQDAEDLTIGNHPNHDNDQDDHNDRRGGANGFMPTQASANHEISSSTAWACSDDDDSDDDRLFGTGNGNGNGNGGGNGGDNSGYRYGVASPGGGDRIFSLSSDSSHWTPLQGSEFARSPSQQQPWDRPANSDERNVSACGANEATDGIISALRAAVNTSARESVCRSKGRVDPTPGRCGDARGSHRRGVSFAGGLGVCEAGKGCGSAVLEALGKLAHDTALLEGAIEGVEGEVAGGIFVKVSFIDGGGGDVSSCATNAMFRCKTLLHTTGSGPANRGDMGWDRGEFQCEAFHGGRLEELASAGVLFSAHRRDTGKRSRGKRDCKPAVNKDRDGFLGQVMLPLRGIVNNMRPIIVDDSTRASQTNASDYDHSTARKLQHDDPGDEAPVVRIERTTNGWKSLRGELSGDFPSVDRGGRVSLDEDGGLVLRLRLSVSIALKPAGSSGSSKKRDQHASLAPPRPHWAANGNGRIAAWGEGSGGGHRNLPCKHSTAEAIAICEGHPKRVVVCTRGGNPRTPATSNLRVGGVQEPSSPSLPPRKNKNARGRGGGLPSRGLQLRQGPPRERRGPRERRQEEIARENERMERRLKAIREAAPRNNSGSGGVGGMIRRHVRGQQSLGRRRRREAGWDRGRGKLGANGGVPLAGVAADAAGGAGGRREETRRKCTLPSSVDQGKHQAESRWRRLYEQRQAAASKVEAAGAETAGVRARVEALRAKTLWTEANARSATLAVASLHKAVHPRGRSPSTVASAGAKDSAQYGDGHHAKEVGGTVGAAGARGAAGGVFCPVYSGIDGVVDVKLAAELARQEDLYKALVGARQKVVMRAEEARLAREADLKTLENLNAQLAEAEDRQAHYQWRQRDDPSRGDQTRGLAAAGSHRDEGDAVPKDPFERAQDLLLSLRVDVETLRSEEAMFGDKTETGVEGGGAGTDHSRAVQEAREEMTKLAARLENKKGRLESAYVDRDATRAEYQHWETNGRRSALKESLAWLEHATLQLAGT